MRIISGRVSVYELNSTRKHKIMEACFDFDILNDNNIQVVP